MPIYRDLPLSIEVDDLLRAQGADPQILRTRRPRLVQAAQEALETGRDLLDPIVLSETYTVRSLRHERLELEGSGTLNGPLIATHLAGAQQVIVMLCTVGPHLETQAAELMRSDPVRALALDALGSAAAEVLAVAACNRIEAETTARGWKVSMPLNPGMIGWPVEQGQPEIFACLQAGRIGVQMTGSRLMKPLKSISLVIGLGPQLGSTGRPCDYCTMSATCRYQHDDA